MPNQIENNINKYVNMLLYCAAADQLISYLNLTDAVHFFQRNICLVAHSTRRHLFMFWKFDNKEIGSYGLFWQALTKKIAFISSQKVDNHIFPFLERFLTRGCQTHCMLTAS